MTYLPNDDPSLIISQGSRAGTTHKNKFGVNLSINIASVPEDVWSVGGTWVPPTAARIHDIVSASANDTAAGTGMRTMYIQGLDGDFSPIAETVTLNGTTNVPTTNSYLRIFRMYGVTWGSSGVNAGIIDATAQTDGTVSAEIGTSGQPNATEMAIYTTPLDKSGYLTQYELAETKVSGSGSSANVFLLIRDASETNNGWRALHRSLVLLEAGSILHRFIPYQVVPPKHDIKLTVVEVTANGTGVIGGFDIILA